MTHIEAMKQALEALQTERDKYMEWGDEDGAPEEVYDAITALRTAIEQAEKQEPVGEICWAANVPNSLREAVWFDYVSPPVGTKLYTTPPAAQRQWVGLTDEEVLRVWLSPEAGKIPHCDRYLHYYRAIEAKLREKNGGQA